MLLYTAEVKGEEEANVKLQADPLTSDQPGV